MITVTKHRIIACLIFIFWIIFSKISEQHTGFKFPNGFRTLSPIKCAFAGLVIVFYEDSRINIFNRGNPGVKVLIKFIGWMLMTVFPAIEFLAAM